MLTKSWTAFFFFLVIAPISAILINGDAFFVIMSFVIITISCKSLKQLLIINFASDEVFTKFQAQTEVYRRPTKREMKLHRANLFCINALIVLFFVYSFFAAEYLWIKVAAVIITGNWLFDILKTAHNMFFPRTASSLQTWGDFLAEFYLWVHNITSIAFVFIVFFTKFSLSIV